MTKFESFKVLFPFLKLENYLTKALVSYYKMDRGRSNAQQCFISHQRMCAKMKHISWSCDEATTIDN
jgi:hypothetical protein